MDDEPDSDLEKKAGLVDTLTEKIDFNFYKIPVKITHSGNLRDASEEEKNKAELELMRGEEGSDGLNNLIKELNEKNKEITLGIKWNFCYYSEDCDNHFVDQRVGIDTNCSKKKSYHCDVLLGKMGRERFIDYIQMHRNNMTQKEFEKNLNFARTFNLK